MLSNEHAMMAETKVNTNNSDEFTVMIVDDEVYTVELLKTVLKPLGFTTIGVTSGSKALEIIENDHVDLLLLDIMMPDVSGYDVIRKLKSDKKTSMIPIIVISALSGLKDNIQAIELGAEGFMTKPFNNQLVTAYVKSLASIKQLANEISKLNQLKDDLTRMIIHDLKNPLISALGFVNLMGKEDSAEKLKWYAGIIRNSVSDSLNLIENLHDITRLENNKIELKKKEENIYLLITDLIDAMIPIFQKRGLSTNLISECSLTHNVDSQVFKRVMQNLFSNAARFANKNSTIMITITKKDALTVRVSNEGDIIPEEYNLKVFEKFGQVELSRESGNIGTGLGLAYCKMAIEAHNGRIWLESPAVEFTDGTSFIFEIR